MAFGRLSASPVLRTVPRGTSFSVGTIFNETGGNTYGGRPLYTDGHIHQPTLVSNQHLGGTFGAPTEIQGASPRAEFFPDATFCRELHGDIGLAYTPLVGPALHDSHHCIPVIVAPTVTSSISHLLECVPGAGQPHMDNLLRHG